MKYYRLEYEIKNTNVVIELDADNKAIAERKAKNIIKEVLCN